MRLIRGALVMAVLLVPAAAHAEYLRIELTIFGMDCATCAHGISVAMKKLEGIESVELSLNRSTADLRLRAGNRITLAQLRQIVKNNGFTAKEAIVTAAGTPVQKAGARLFAVAGTDEVLTIVTPRSDAGAVKQLEPAAPLQISGTVVRSSAGADEIAIRTVSRGR